MFLTHPQKNVSHFPPEIYFGSYSSIKVEVASPPPCRCQGGE